MLGADHLLRSYPYVLAGAACAGLRAVERGRVSALRCALLAVGAAARRGVPGRPARADRRCWRSRSCSQAGGGEAPRLDALDSSVCSRTSARREPARWSSPGRARTGGFDLRVPARLSRFGSVRRGRARPAPAPARPRAAPGRHPRARRAAEAAAPGLERLRRAHLAPAPRRPRGRHGKRLAHRRPPRRDRRLRGPRPRLARAARSHPGSTGERRAVLEGIVLGEDEGLSPDLQDAFRASGLYHLLAVSGSNVMFVALGVLGLAWVLGLPRWLGELGALAGIGSYVLAVGAQPSVIRAGIAGALGIARLARGAGSSDRWHFLLVGALVLLAWNPYTLLDAGFQLSFAAVAAIFVVVPRAQRFLEGYPVPKRARRRGRDLVRVRRSPPRRSSGSSSGGSRSTRCRRTPSRRRSSARCSASRSRPRSPTRSRLRSPVDDRLGERLARRLPRLVRAVRRRAARGGRLVERRARRRCCWSRPRSPSLAGCGAEPRPAEALTMLAARGGRAETGLPAHRQRPPEDRARPPPAPRPVRRGRGRAALRAGRRPATTRSPPATRWVSSAAAAGWCSSKRSSAGRRPTRRRSPTTWPRPRPTPCSRSSPRRSARTRRSRRRARRRASCSSTRSRSASCRSGSPSSSPATA